MELCELKPIERNIEITHPRTGENLGVSVSIISLNDPRITAIKRKIQNQSLSLERRGKSFKADEVEENLDLLLVSAMTGWVWSGDATFHGEKPAFSEKNVRDVFKELPWFKAQIQEAVGNEEAFFTK